MRTARTGALAPLSVAALVKCSGSDDSTPAAAPAREGFNVAKVARCGANDKPEAALQGQVPIAVRSAAGGFQGYNCNLSLVGQLQGEGGNWSSATVTDRVGRTCAKRFHRCRNACQGAGPGEDHEKNHHVQQRRQHQTGRS